MNSLYARTALPVTLSIAILPPLYAADIRGVERFEIVSRLTGAASINRTNLVGIGGTDLGHTVNHNGRTYFLFGDTFSGETPSEGGNWRSNVMAYTLDSNPSDGILFDDWITGSTGLAREVIQSGRGNPITEIPTGAVSLNNRIYAYYMAVNWWGPAGQWTNDYAGLASWGEGESAFTVHDGFEFAGSGNFGMVAAATRPAVEGVPEDDHVYVWGTPAGRFGGVKLARVLPTQIDRRSEYEFFDGLFAGVPQWTNDEQAGDLIVPANVGEMSVMYNEAVRAWTMLYFSESNAAFEIRQSPAPWGPWSNPVRVATSAQAPGGLYAPYMNPAWVENGGETIYFTMSLWNTYDVYLAKARLTLTPPTIAFAHFEEPPINAASYTPGPNGAELGFQTASTPTVGSGPFASVVASGSSPTTPIFSHQSVDATTTFAAVDLSEYDNITVSLLARVRSTTYEGTDRLRIFVTDGATQIDLLNRSGAGLNALATLDYQSYSANIPDSWIQASLVISSRSDSSTGVERFDFDNILFQGTSILPPLILGDANRDGVVDRADLALLVRHLGKSVNALWEEGDFNGDGHVGLLDIALLQRFYELTEPAASLAASHVPEPSTSALFGIACALLAVGQGRRRHASPTIPHE